MSSQAVWDRPPHHHLGDGSGVRDFFRRRTDQADRERRPTRHANAFLPASRCALPLAPAPRARRGVGRRPPKRRVSGRLAPSRFLRGALLGFDLAAGDRALQGARRVAGAGCGTGRDDASTVADTADDPEVVLQKKDRSELLRHSLERLSPEHGEVIDLVYYHGSRSRTSPRSSESARPQ